MFTMHKYLSYIQCDFTIQDESLQAPVPNV